MNRLFDYRVQHDPRAMSSSDMGIPLSTDKQEVLRDAEQSLIESEPSFDLQELEVFYEAERRTLWTFMCSRERPSFTHSLLQDFEQWQASIHSRFGGVEEPLDYIVLGSLTPGVFCLGGDLDLFQHLIRERDRDGLIAYGYRCVEILHRNMNCLNLPLVTIGVVQGQALGGGFEALLSFDYIIAEKGSTFGLPEMAFGLFPGMGAHVLLSRKLGTAMADRLILGNEILSAEKMYELGIVHMLAEPGEGVSTARHFIDKSRRQHKGIVNARKATRLVAPIELEEFYRVVDLWAEAALQLSAHDLRYMNKLVSAQRKLEKAV